MAISRSLSRRSYIALLQLLLLLVPMVIPSLFVHGSRLSAAAEERQLLRTAEDNDNTAVPDSSCKTNNYTVGSDGNVTSLSSSSSSRSGVDNSDRLVPTGPNPLHHRHH